MAHVIISILSLTLVCFFMAGTVEKAGAQSAAEVNISAQSSNLQSRFSFLDILDSDSRSKQFAGLRTKRSDITRNIFKLEQNLRETQASAESLQKSIREFKISRDFMPPPYIPSIFTSNSELERQTFERQSEMRSYNAAVAQVDRNIEAMRARITPDVSARELSDIEKEIRDLDERKLGYGETNKINLAKIDFEIERIKKSIEENERNKIEFDKQAAENEVTAKLNLESLESRLKEKSNEIFLLKDQVSNSQSDLDVIDAEIVSLIDLSDADSQFKITISMTFAFLVLAIIVGFFYIANSSRAIVESIFSNDSGIQFITLFSIVIAVILFGIIGVLEGKELSALLGGLSGYILGRGSNNLNQGGNRPPSDPPPAQSQPAPPSATAQPSPPTAPASAPAKP
ncbi:MAG: hypothetical protein ACSHXI_06090 [Hoeflea sp.]|uniref:hypothetical protein n=1 Tax=Hoeflea sp. TaxID=1940281 RepID=UPI003EFA0C83